MHVRLAGAAAWGGGTHANYGFVPSLHVLTGNPQGRPHIGMFEGFSLGFANPVRRKGFPRALFIPLLSYGNNMLYSLPH